MTKYTVSRPHGNSKERTTDSGVSSPMPPMRLADTEANDVGLRRKMF